MTKTPVDVSEFDVLADDFGSTGIIQNPKLCECGCGRPTPIARSTDSTRGHVRGQQMRFVRSHARKRPGLTIHSFLARCERVGECLIWRGHLSIDGYGQVEGGGKNYSVHRFIWECVNGPIPAGLTIDHVASRGCKSRACCEIDHMELVTNKVNILRGDSPSARCARQTHCMNGHLLHDDNLEAHALAKGIRRCKACAKVRSANYYKKRCMGRSRAQETMNA